MIITTSLNSIRFCSFQHGNDFKRFKTRSQAHTIMYEYHIFSIHFRCLYVKHFLTEWGIPNVCHSYFTMKCSNLPLMVAIRVMMYELHDPSKHGPPRNPQQSSLQSKPHPVAPAPSLRPTSHTRNNANLIKMENQSQLQSISSSKGT